MGPNSLGKFMDPAGVMSGGGGADAGGAGLGSSLPTPDISKLMPFKPPMPGGGGALNLPKPPGSGALGITKPINLGSVICTALHDFGLMDDDTYAADCIFGGTLPAEVFRGYQRWAIPVAKAMRRSFVLTGLIEPFALSWARTMKAKVEGHPEREERLGIILLRFGIPLCAWLGREKKARFAWVR